MQNDYDVLIIGAGVSGITIAKELKAKYLILEKQNTLGGLSTQYLENGYHFDYGGHYFHFQNRENILEYIKSYSKFNKYIKKSMSFIGGRRIPFPVQYNISYFKKNIRDRIYKEIIENNRETEKTNNLESYLKTMFGKTLFDLFFNPFLSKYFGFDLKNLQPSMDKGSIPVPDKKDVIDGYNGKKFKGLGYNPVFYYPQKGLNDFIQSYSKDIYDKVEFESEVIKIDLEEKLVYTKNNTFHYRILINTMPLKHFLAISKNSGMDEDLGQNLLNISTIVSNIVLRKRNKRFNWAYLPDRNTPFYRFGYYPETNIVKGYLERTVKKDFPLQDDRNIIYKTLKSLGVVENKNEILFVSNKFIPVSYIIFDKNWIETVPLILKNLRDKNIFSIGRYGSWDYTSMTEDIFNAIKLVRGINDGNI